MASDEQYNAYPIIDPRIRIGPPYLTRYERARIIGIRAFQLEFGIPPLVPPERVGSTDPLVIARYEVDNGILPLSVYRYVPGKGGQSIPLKLLLELGRKIGVNY
jgi:DNA-directed RNA polymerase subunit K